MDSASAIGKVQKLPLIQSWAVPGSLPGGSYRFPPNSPHPRSHVTPRKLRKLGKNGSLPNSRIRRRYGSFKCFPLVIKEIKAEQVQNVFFWSVFHFCYISNDMGYSKFLVEKPNAQSWYAKSLYCTYIWFLIRGFYKSTIK